MLTLDFLIFLVVVHYVGTIIDWIFQWQWQAINKSKWFSEKKIIKAQFKPIYKSPYTKLTPSELKTEKEEKPNYLLSFLAVTSHAFVYSAFTTNIIYWLKIISLEQFLVVFIYLFLTHAIIDTRIPVKWLMKFKGLSDDQINDYQNYGFMHLGLDHRLHELSIFILALIMK